MGSARRTDIFAEHIFKLARQEATLDQQGTFLGNGTSGTQFSQHKVEDMITLSVHGLAVLFKVGPHNLLGTDSGNAGGFHRALAALGITALLIELIVYTCEQLFNELWQK